MKDNKNSLDFIGLGLTEVEGMTRECLNAVRSADVVFAEFYTSLPVSVSLRELENALGKKIVLLSRDQVESGDLILNTAREKRVAFIAGGDSMSATTHVELRLRAVRERIPTRIYHAPTVLTAVPSVLGLSHYKFGRTTTLVFPRTNFFPMSPYDVIEANISMGFHTLVLLDIITDDSPDFENISSDFQRCDMRFGGMNYILMPSRTAVNLLSVMEDEREKGILHPHRIICSVARAGGERVMARAGYLKDMLNVDMGEPLHSLVIPGKLHFMEAKALVELAGAPPDILSMAD